MGLIPDFLSLALIVGSGTWELKHTCSLPNNYTNTKQIKTIRLLLIWSQRTNMWLLARK